ncbi:MAG: hypothetical protein K9N55_15735 [Phycisphaerae bacterium]|nr:hypothetical protein [Phycisphaerae bacterium]
MSQQQGPHYSGCFVLSWLWLVCALCGSGLTAAEYQADSPNPANGNKTVDPSNVRLTWSPAQQASSQTLYLGTNPVLTASARITTLSRSASSYFFSPGFELGQTYYWRIDTLDALGTLYTGETWSFTTLSYQASQPNPTPGTQWVTSKNTTLTWQAGLLAVSHEVYFGTNQEHVRLGFTSAYLGLVVGTGQLHYPLPPLEKGTTYYWRIDERQGSGYVTPGDLWQFRTLESEGGIQGRYFDNTYLGEDPVLTRTDKGVNLNFAQDNPLRRVLTLDAFSVRWTGQLFIPQSKTITLSVVANDCVRLCVDGQTVIDDWTTQPTRQLNTTLPPGLGTSVQIVLEYAHYQGDPQMQLLWSYDQLEPQIIPNGPLQPPTVSHFPKPLDFSQAVNHSPRLSWQSGTTATMHDLYLGTDLTSVAQAQSGDSEFLVRQNKTTYDLANLAPNRTYYWRVDDVNYLNQPNVTPGQIWQFSTANYYVIDDFESYTNTPSQRIFEAWIDGWGYQQPLPGQPGNNTGATVGHIDRPYAEQDMVHAGCQSMPLAYQNDDRYQRSEATRTFAVPLNMTTQQNRPLKTLSLAFHGLPDSVGQSLKHQDTFTLTGTGTGFWQEDDRCYFVSQSVSGSASISARLDRLDEIHALSQAGIMIRQSNEPNVAQACIAVTADGRLACHYRSDPGQPVISQYSEPGTVTLPHWIKLQRLGATLSLSHSPDGLTWLPVTLDTQPFMSLSGFASLGLMHCVYKDNLTQGTAVFTQVTSTSVAPFNTTSSLGIPVNGADDLYLCLEDTQGNRITLTHPDKSQAVLQPRWQTWNIALSDLAGIHVDAIKALSIGVGSPNNLKPGGAGLIFIDDIGLHP